MDNGPERRAILADLGYMEMRRTIPEAFLRYKSLPYRDPSPDQVRFDPTLGHNRIPVEIFFGR
jgi:hypothetical protein